MIQGGEKKERERAVLTKEGGYQNGLVLFAQRESLVGKWKYSD